MSAIVGQRRSRSPGTDTKVEKRCKIDPAYLCAICTEVCTEPVTVCAQDHLFCAHCIDTWFATKRSCPTCRALVPDNVRPRPCSLVKRMLADTPVRCILPDVCNWQGVLSKRAAHLEECLYMQVTCTHVGCTHSCLRKELEAHELDCPKQVRSLCSLAIKPLVHIAYSFSCAKPVTCRLPWTQ